MRGTGLLVTGLFLAAGSTLALSAQPSNAAVCGFLGEGTSGLGGGSDDKDLQKGTYMHCAKKGNVKIHVDYHYGYKEMCVTPGETTLWADYALGALKNAYYVGSC
ncbi:DUF6355 family natural product biosynthesis protein [Glutamicibacter sp. TV12E]|uniref:DUF6355 family natural product biosynthesis protein n=1 Tax=Glutamicibacter sp. TV12E TaxID=3446362 RepID=UPI0040331E7E